MGAVQTRANHWKTTALQPQNSGKIPPKCQLNLRITGRKVLTSDDQATKVQRSRAGTQPAICPQRLSAVFEEKPLEPVAHQSKALTSVEGNL
jgi:hypothetical protein